MLHVLYIHVYYVYLTGWYEGERIRDGEKGWFHSMFTEEIQSAHTRNKNQRQQYRMLKQSHDELEQKVSKQLK